MANDDDERIVPPDVVYNIFIRTTPQKVWDALTQERVHDAIFLRPHASRAIGSKGSPWKLLFPDGRVDVEGEVLESDPPKLLKVTWRVDWLEDARSAGPALITYEIQQHGEIVQADHDAAHRQRHSAQVHRRPAQMGWGDDPLIAEEPARDRQGARHPDGAAAMTMQPIVANARC